MPELPNSCHRVTLQIRFFSRRRFIISPSQESTSLPTLRHYWLGGFPCHLQTLEPLEGFRGPAHTIYHLFGFVAHGVSVGCLQDVVCVGCTESRQGTHTIPVAPHRGESPGQCRPTMSFQSVCRRLARWVMNMTFIFG